MGKFEDIFDTEDQQPISMTHQEYFDKTKALLNKLADEYSQAWGIRALKENEYPEESICNKCLGRGTFEGEYGEGLECVLDRERGGC